MKIRDTRSQTFKQPKNNGITLKPPKLRIKFLFHEKKDNKATASRTAHCILTNKKPSEISKKKPAFVFSAAKKNFLEKIFPDLNLQQNKDSTKSKSKRKKNQ